MEKSSVLKMPVRLNLNFENNKNLPKERKVMSLSSSESARRRRHRTELTLVERLHNSYPYSGGNPTPRAKLLAIPFLIFLEFF